MSVIIYLFRRTSIQALLIMAARIIGLACLTSVAVAQPVVSVEIVTGGYLLEIPASAIERASFDRIGNAPVVLKLSDPQLGDTQISGTVERIAKNRLQLKTTSKLKYLPTSRTLITAKRSEVLGFPLCVDIDQAPFVGACTITYCPTVITCGSTFGSCQCLD